MHLDGNKISYEAGRLCVYLRPSPPHHVGRHDRYSHLAMGAAKIALADGTLDAASVAPKRFGVLIGSGAPLACPASPEAPCLLTKEACTWSTRMLCVWGGRSAMGSVFHERYALEISHGLQANRPPPVTTYAAVNTYAAVCASMWS